MLRYAVTYPLTLAIFAAIDAIWLTSTANPLYRATLGDLLLEKFRVGPAAAFYLVYLAGIMVFVVQPAVASGRWTAALWRGAFFGAVAYATYDLTNYATLKAWSLQLTVLDMLWGAFVTGTAGTLGYAAGGWLLRGAFGRR
jgi:uncharacterized membrane protein